MNDIETNDSEWWLTKNDEEMTLANPHIKHLIGKEMWELHEMFPNANVCYSRSCKFTNLDHAIFMEYEQLKHDSKLELRELEI